MSEGELLAERKDRAVSVRREAAGNANATEAVLRVTALDPDKRVREAVATNSKAALVAQIVSVL